MKDAIQSCDRQLQAECLNVFAEIHRRSRSFEVFLFRLSSRVDKYGSLSVVMCHRPCWYHTFLNPQILLNHVTQLKKNTKLTHTLLVDGTLRANCFFLNNNDFLDFSKPIRFDFQCGTSLIHSSS